MRDAERYAFTAADSGLGEAGFMPQLPLTLIYKNQPTSVIGLLDTGAAVNDLPYAVGIELGAVWNEKLSTIKLTGNLAEFEACPLIVSAGVAQFPPVRMAFAWTKADDVPLILGQVNFFMEFDVCFYRSQRVFELRPKA